MSKNLPKNFLFKLSSVLCVAVSKVLLLLSHSMLKGFLFVLPKTTTVVSSTLSTPLSSTNTQESKLYECNGEMFTLEEIADLIMMDQKEIAERMKRGESLTNIVDNLTAA